VLDSLFGTMRMTFIGGHRLERAEAWNCRLERFNQDLTTVSCGELLHALRFKLKLRFIKPFEFPNG